MRLRALEFSGFPPGVTDFATLLQTTDQPDRAVLEEVCSRVAGQVLEPVPGRVTSLIVVGHSDRQDRPELTCDQRRASEIDAAEQRAASAWELVKALVTEEIVEVAGPAGTWWEDDPSMTWGLVFAATGMLKHPEPTTEAQRLANRRVVILVSEFDPE